MPNVSRPMTRASRQNSAWPLRFNCSRAGIQHSAPSAAAAPALRDSPGTPMAKAGH